MARKPKPLPPKAKKSANDKPAPKLTKKGVPAKPKGGPRPGAGRPHGIDLDPSVADRICHRVETELVRAEVAAAEEGVPPTTFARWIAEGRAGKSPELVEFGERVARARLIAEGRLVRDVRVGDEPGTSFGPSKAALELLQRTVKAYQPKIKIGVEEELNKFLDAALRVLPNDLFRLLLDELAALEESDE